MTPEPVLPAETVAVCRWCDEAISADETRWEGKWSWHDRCEREATEELASARHIDGKKCPNCGADNPSHLWMCWSCHTALTDDDGGASGLPRVN